ncbi:hypothetical protein CEXT_786841, partial [Caerostris extrusa]
KINSLVFSNELVTLRMYIGQIKMNYSKTPQPKEKQPVKKDNTKCRPRN